MVRAPCCEKIGIKKGPWTLEEDQILTSYIQKHGHANWRALPKQAGLLRCGKSCRLRWINYLRPDIKRGNFTNEEEEIIIKMHELLGNRWSAIAAKLPGRTDNEIKNVWHTHLKKKTNNQQNNSNGKRIISKSKIKRSDSNSSTITTTSSTSTFSSDFSSSEGKNNMKIEEEEEEEEEASESLVTMPEIDESFWSEEAANDDACSNMVSINDSWTVSNDSVGNIQHQESFDDGMDFWYDLFLKSEDSIELPEF